MRHSQPLINTVTKRLLGLVQHDEAPEANPFKKEKAAAQTKEASGKSAATMG